MPDSRCVSTSRARATTFLEVELPKPRECFLDVYPSQARHFHFCLADVAVEIYRLFSRPFFFHRELFQLFIHWTSVLPKDLLRWSLFNAFLGYRVSRRFERQAYASN